MKLADLAAGYLETAALLRVRLRQLRQALKSEEDPEERASIRHELAELGAILTQCYELAELTEHYYERGYKRNEKYTL